MGVSSLAIGLMVLLAVGLAVLLKVGGKPLSVQGLPQPREEPAAWPPAVVIVPVAGQDPLLAENLTSLLHQSYPDFQLLVVTRDLSDPAVPVIETIVAGDDRARHITSGRAETCGQKNHNLLAGVRAAAPDRTVLVFNDSTRTAPVNYLRELIRPLALGKADVTSGYHHLIPQDPGLATIGRTATVLALFVSRGIKQLMQPWGGSTAIWKNTFENLDVAKLWAENVVDDVSLAARLVKAKTTLISTPGACLTSPLAGETLLTWKNWLTRQILYLKFCFPGSWLAFGIGIYLAAGSVLTAAGWLILTAWGLVHPGLALAGGLYLISLAALGCRARVLHPAPGPRSVWATALPANIFMASFCHLMTLTARTIEWRGIVYQVGPEGRVLDIN